MPISDHTPANPAAVSMNPRERARTPIGYVTLIGVVAASAGFLFGYDTAVVSGAIGFLKAHFALTTGLTGWAASSILIGCTFGALAAGPLSDRFGRKPSLAFCGLLFATSSLASALPHSIGQFAAARFVGGLAIGAASILSPIYIAEVAPAKYRGRLVALYQLAIVVGILVVFFVNLQIQRQGDLTWNEATGWRVMFASLVPPSLLFVLCVLLVPESPRWLLKVGRTEQARTVLARVAGASQMEGEIHAIRGALGEQAARWRELFASGHRRALIVGGMLAIFQQLSGINAIIYYAPEIFTAAGFGRDAAFANTVIIGVVNLVFTFLAIGLVDRVGRRPLLLVGTLLQTLAHLAVGWFMSCGVAGWPLVTSMLVFIGAFAMAMGPVTWIVNAEIFPTRLRGRAISASISALWLTNWLVTQLFPSLQATLGTANTFWGFAALSLATFVFVLRMVPETKGRTLEQIESEWAR
ncbi:MAG: sugar porter family MFS transporter [Luteitalea sp.]|nr:sugar porter family MFS transporter [Luteitalea sp.]